MILKDKFNILRPNTTSREFLADSGIKCVHYGDIYKNYKNKIISSNNIINSFTLDVSNNKIITTDSIIFPDVTETIKDYGVFCYINYNEPYINGTHTFAISNNNDNNNLKYLFYYLQSNRNRSRLQQLLLGSTVFQISLKDIEKYKLTNYHSEEFQQHIVDIIGSIDDKIENNEKIVEKLKDLGVKKYDLLSSNTKTLIEEISFQKGKEASAKNYIAKDKNTIPYIRVKDLLSMGDTHIPNNLNIPLCNNEDILISFDGAIGRINFGLNGGYSSGVYKVAPNDSTKYGIYYWCLLSEKNQQIMKEHTNGTTILHASKCIEFLKIKDYIIEDINFFNNIYDNILAIKKENTKLNELKQLYLNNFFN